MEDLVGCVADAKDAYNQNSEQVKESRYYGLVGSEKNNFETKQSWSHKPACVAVCFGRTKIRARLLGRR